MLNDSALMGRICNDLELKTTPGGKDVISFTIAVDRDYKVDGKYPTDFIDVFAWENTARFIANNFRKGRMIAIKGNIETRLFTDRNNNKRKVTEIKIESAYFADSKSDAQSTAENKAESAGSFSPTDFTEITVNEEDLPF